MKATNTPVSSIKALCRIISIPEKQLHQILSNKEMYYREFVNKNGRLVNQILPPLSLIHKKLRSFFFNRLKFPHYLKGGISGTDHIKNAEVHTNKTILIQEDITRFYPNITHDKVKKLFQNFFKCTPEVSELIADICCINNTLITGSSISTDISNSIFYKAEPILFQELQNKYNCTYSRYIDDITVSSKNRLSKQDISQIKIKIKAFLASQGFKTNRSKSQIDSKGQNMSVHRITVNRQVQLSKALKNKIRMEVFNLKKMINNNSEIQEISNYTSSLIGKINHASRLGYKDVDKDMIAITSAIHNINKKDIAKFISSIKKCKSSQSLKQLMKIAKPLYRHSKHTRNSIKKELLKVKKNLLQNK